MTAVRDGHNAGWRAACAARRERGAGRRVIPLCPPPSSNPNNLLLTAAKRWALTAALRLATRSRNDSARYWTVDSIRSLAKCEGPFSQHNSELVLAPPRPYACGRTKDRPCAILVATGRAADPQARPNRVGTQRKQLAVVPIPMPPHVSTGAGYSITRCARGRRRAGLILAGIIYSTIRQLVVT